MRNFPKPVVVVSKCLGFDRCRWNGITVTEEFVEKLKPFVEYKTVCPEVEIGLGVPRDPIRVVRVKKEERLMQPATGRDVTEEMQSFVSSFLDSVGEPDGFILKFRSPSCGMYNVKLYPNLEKSGAVGKTRGFFGAEVLRRFPHLAVEDEGRVRNFKIREHFLTLLFTRASFRALKNKPSMKTLVKFQSENKLLLMAYSQTALKSLGKIVANHDKKPIAKLLGDYEEHLNAAFARAPRFTSNINVLMHALGYFSKELTAREKAFFLENLEGYRIGKMPLSVPVSIIRSWIVRFDQKYLAPQTFFEPYPSSLVEITDSGKGRKITK